MLSKKKFEAYEEVRRSGITNMFMVPTVMAISGLSKDEVRDIMNNYDTYYKRFTKVRKKA